MNDKENHALPKSHFESGRYNQAIRILTSITARIASNPTDQMFLNESRLLLIESMIQKHREGDSYNSILNEFENLFTGYLSNGDRLAALKSLISKFQFLEYLNLKESFEIAFKAIELFSNSANSEIKTSVDIAYSFLFCKLNTDDDRFSKICLDYGKFLENPIFECSKSLTIIFEIDEALDFYNNELSISILDSFLSARSKNLEEEDIENLKFRLAANYIYIEKYENAIIILIQLLMHGGNVSRLDYILWCGESFMHLHQYDTASMFFREIIYALSNSPEDQRLAIARESLQECQALNSE